MPSPRTSQRGSSLIELMIAMAVLAVGLLAMWHLHVLGLTSTAAGRRQTIATAVARELVSGLERLAFTDPLISENYTGQGTGSGPPSGTLFGALVDGSGTIRSGAHEWSDTVPVPGVRLDSQMREKAEGVGYERRWTVWSVLSPAAAAGSTVGVKLIAVSVIWRDPPFGRPREVVLYVQVPNPGAIAAGLGNTQ
jgi:prepilin-type N-terminal cleavage/methylation domain-containing protein